MGRHWLRKSSCCSLVPHRDHLRWKVLELQLCIASLSVSACWLRHSTTTVQLYCPGTDPLCFYTALYRASAFGKSNQTLFALSLQHHFPVWACLTSALTCTQLLHSPSIACKCHFRLFQNLEFWFIFYHDIGRMASNGASKENAEQHETLEFSISHRVLLYLSSPLSQEDIISSEKLVIFDWLFFFLPLPLWIKGINSNF